MKNKPPVTGFRLASAPVRRRIVMALDGMWKSGKSHFCLTAPPPIHVLLFDIGGLEGVVQKFQDEKEIHIKDFDLESIDRNRGVDRVAAQAGELWDDFSNEYDYALSRGGTTIVDTSTDTWELVRLAEFGKTEQVKPHHYAVPNAKFRSLVRRAYEYDTNVIFTHRLKKEYVNDKNTGNWERAGFGETGFMVQVNARCWKEPVSEGAGAPAFHLTVTDCRLYPEVEGLDLTGPTFSFAWLAVNIFPATTLEDWGGEVNV